MLNMKSKYRVAWFMTVLLILQVMMPVGMVSFAANEVFIHNVDVNSKNIDIDDDFSIDVIVKSVVAQTGVTLKVTGGDFITDGKSTFNIGSLKADDPSDEIRIDLIRTGKSNALNISFIDNTDDSVIGSDTIYISEAEIIEDDDDDDDPQSIAEKDPDLVLDMDASVQEFTAGQEGKLRVNLDVLERTATDIKITFTDSAEDLPFIFEDSKPYLYLDKLTKNGTTVTKDITISPLAKSKVYGLNLKFEYKNTSEDKYTKDVVLYVKISNAEIEPILGISEYKFSQSKLVAGEDGKQAVAIRIKNSGTLEARDVRAQLTGFTADGIHIDNDVDTKAINKIDGGEEELVYFTIKPAESAGSGQYPLELKLTYNDEAGTDYSKTANVYVPVEGKDSEAIEMEVTDMVYPENVTAGETFDVSFKLTNLSEIDAKYVELEMEYPAGFVPKKSPKKYIKDFESGAEIEHTFKMMAKEDVETNHYDMYINVSYKAEGDDEEESIKEYVGVGVDGSSGLGRPKILVDDYTFEGDTVMAGEVFDLNLRFFNTSSDDIVKT